MSNGDTQNNCVMEVCCGGPGDEEKQVRALTKLIRDHVEDVSGRDTKAIAAWLVGQYDFAPKGSLYAFKQEVARLARETPPYHE